MGLNLPDLDSQVWGLRWDWQPDFMKSSTSLKWGKFLKCIIYWTESFNELKKKERERNISILLLYWKSEEGRGAPAFPQVKRFYLRKKGERAQSLQGNNGNKEPIIYDFSKDIVKIEDREFWEHCKSQYFYFKDVVYFYWYVKYNPCCS